MIKLGISRIININTYRITNKRLLTTIPITNRDSFIKLQSVNNAEVATKYIESLSLEGYNSLEIIEDSTHLFNDYVNKMYPLQIIRVMNSYAHLNFSNENILKSVLIRSNEMCNNASPQRALELLTLYRRLNLSHEQLVKPLADSLVKHMNNYSYELYHLGKNASYLNMNDPVFVESFKTQVMLKQEEISCLNAIKNFESLSRFRVDCPEILDNIFNSVMKNKKMSIKELIYLLSAFARLQDERFKKFSELLTNEVESRDLTVDDISTLLTLQNSTRMVHLKSINAILNSVEMLLKDTKYIKTQLIYHLFMLSQLFCDKNHEKIWTLILDKVFSSIEGFLEPTQMVQLLYTISVLKSQNLFDKTYDEIVTQLKSTHQKLNVKEQELLYDSVVTSYSNSQDKVVGKILKEKMPSKLPLMYGNTKNIKLGRNGGKNLVYMEDNNKKLKVIKFINEDQVLNVVDLDISVVESPPLQLETKVVEKLHNNMESYSNCIECIYPNTKLKKLLK